MLDPMTAPGLYTEHFYSRTHEGDQPIAVAGAVYAPLDRFDEPDSGLTGTVMFDASTGHAVILYKGMNRLTRDRGGLGAMFTDIRAIMQAKFGTANDQYILGDRAYIEALCDAQIKSIEVVGYSLGSQLANYLAVKYGAVGTVFGDMGLDRTVLQAYAARPAAVSREQMRQNITSLSLSGDMLVKMFGVGDRVGAVVDLPGGISGFFHDPEVYAYAANAVLHDREQDRRSQAHVLADQPHDESPLSQRLRER